MAHETLYDKATINGACYNWVIIYSLVVTLIMSICLPSLAQTTKIAQSQYPRYRKAVKNVAFKVESKYQKLDFEKPLGYVYIRAFKQERELELWVSSDKNRPAKLLATYMFTRFSGRMGPKWKQGDYQIPEGFYHIDRFNPASSYHLSLGINYPNASDSKRTDARDPGDDIFIHGSNVTIGCIPLGNEAIEEIYVTCVEAADAGQKRIPIHIFPCRMTNPKLRATLNLMVEMDPRIKTLYQQLEEGLSAFDQTNLVPTIKTDTGGQYLITKRTVD